MKEIKINVEGMHCISCENRIKQVLSKIENVLSVDASYIDEIVTVKYKNNINVNLIKEAIKELGFEIKEI